MFWLLTIVVVVSIFLNWLAYAQSSEDSANNIEKKDSPSSQPIIFLQNTPSDGSRDSTDSAIKNLSLLFNKDSQLKESKIKLVTRLDLRVQVFEPQGFGLYSYLLFGSNSEAGKLKRYAASHAYCKDIPPISEAFRLGLSKENLNVFLVPTKDVPPGVNYCQNAESLVNDFYDYTRAQKLLDELHLNGDGIYLVACESPFLTQGKCDPKKTLVAELTTVNERLIELCILEFRRQQIHLME